MRIVVKLHAEKNLIYTQKTDIILFIIYPCIIILYIISKISSNAVLQKIDRKLDLKS